MNFIKRQLNEYFDSWHKQLTEYRHNVYASLFEGKSSRLLSLGCGFGHLTYKVSKRIAAQQIVGLDLFNLLSDEYKDKIKLVKGDLNKGLPFDKESFDVVSGDQIIEHLYKTDLFVKEIYRVLKPGGYAVICTENLASLHNLFALLLGKQAFSQFISSEYKLGNSLSPHYKKPVSKGLFHVQIFTVEGLRDIFEFYNFKVEKLIGIVYFPFLPFWIGRFFEKILPSHAQFIAVKVRKE